MFYVNGIFVLLRMKSKQKNMIKIGIKKLHKMSKNAKKNHKKKKFEKN